MAEAVRILDASGAPMRPKSKLCPQCGATPDKRVASGGFGRQITDICRVCGHDFQERTL